MVSTPGSSDEISNVIDRLGPLPTAAFVDGKSVERRARARMIAEVARRIRGEDVIIRQLPYDALPYSPPVTLQPAHADRIAEAFAKVLGELVVHFSVSSRLPQTV